MTRTHKHTSVETTFCVCIKRFYASFMMTIINTYILLNPNARHFVSDN